MELLRLPDRRALAGRAAGRGREGPLHVALLPPAPRLQAGQIVEVAQRHPDHHGEHDRSSLQPDLRPLHHHLHLRRHGDAALRQGLHGARLRTLGVRHATLELHRLHAQLHDRLPRAVRGVDRVHVGLHLRRRALLRPLLPRNRPRRESRHSQPLPCFAPLQFLRHGR